MVEAAITSVVFFGLVLFVIDIARYFFTVLVFNYAVSQGVDIAAKLEIETITDGTDSSCEHFENPDPRSCEQYLARVKTVLRHVTDIADLVSGSSSSNASVRRLSFLHYPAANYPAGLQYDADAAFIRPGEMVTSADSLTYQIPGRPYCSPAADGCGAPSSTESWGELLLQLPFAVRLDAEFSPITPLINNLHISAVQYGYRRTRAVSNSGQLPTSPADAEATATPSPPPTSTWNPNWPTHTPTPVSATRTPTTSPTPSNTRVPTIPNEWENIT